MIRCALPCDVAALCMWVWVAPEWAALPRRHQRVESLGGRHEHAATNVFIHPSGAPPPPNSCAPPCRHDRPLPPQVLDQLLEREEGGRAEAFGKLALANLHAYSAPSSRCAARSWLGLLLRAPAIRSAVPASQLPQVLLAKEHSPSLRHRPRHAPPCAARPTRTARAWSSTTATPWSCTAASWRRTRVSPRGAALQGRSQPAWRRRRPRGHGSACTRILASVLLPSLLPKLQAASAPPTAPAASRRSCPPLACSNAAFAPSITSQAASAPPTASAASWRSWATCRLPRRCSCRWGWARGRAVARRTRGWAGRGRMGGRNMQPAGRMEESVSAGGLRLK